VQVLAEPVEDTPFFVGEAPDLNGRNGTVHGVMASGCRYYSGTPFIELTFGLRGRRFEFCILILFDIIFPQLLIGHNNLRQADLVSIFGSRGRVSEVVSGECS
jgi:hypothetical protein